MPSVRRAVAEDAERLASFAARVYAEAFAPDTPPDDLELHLRASYGPAQQAAEIGDASVSTFVAEDGPDLAGYFQLRDQAPPACVEEANALELRRFYVDRPWHGRGLATDLMEAAVREALRRGASALWLSTWEKNGRARAFYEKVGFRVVGTQPFIVGNDVQTDRILVRAIAAADASEDRDRESPR